MPDVMVRKRLGRRSGGWKFRLNRWFYRNRPKIAVLAAFAVACMLGLVAASMGVQNLGSGEAQAETASGAPSR